MASVVVNGDTSGAVTLSAPAVAGTVTVTLPATSGTMLTTASTTGISGSAISSGTVPEAYGGTGTSTGYYGFKNRIINGAMVIDQRNAGASITPSGTSQFSVDRWVNFTTQSGKYSTQQRSTDSSASNYEAGSAPAGFVNSIKITSLSAYSITSGDEFNILQQIEGYNIADFAWGTASASTVTLSFWVKSSLTGTFGGALQNNAQTRAYPFSFTINAANTWEQKSIIIAGETSGAWVVNNGIGVKVAWGLGVGSTFSATAGAWATGNYWSSTGATSVVGTNGATFYITGVQLEKGSTATSFDYRPYGTEYQLCQRYFWKALEGTPSVVMIGTGVVSGATTMRVVIPLPVPMRALPTGTITNTVYAYDGANQQVITSGSFGFSSSLALSGDLTCSAGGFTLGRGLVVYAANGTGNNITASAEL